MVALEGVYHDGVVELKQRPPGVVRARAIVTLLDEVGSDDPAAGVAKALADIRRLMQAVARQGSVVDEFIAERRREAGRE